MVLKRMIVRRFGPFWTRQEIVFASTPSRNITLIRGNLGKSAIAHALVWGLYGTSALPRLSCYFHERDNVSSSGRQGGAPVTIDFEVERTRYRLTRCSAPDQAEHSALSLARYDEGETMVEDADPQAAIEIILPLALSYFCFFNSAEALLPEPSAADLERVIAPKGNAAQIRRDLMLALNELLQRHLPTPLSVQIGPGLRISSTSRSISPGEQEFLSLFLSTTVLGVLGPPTSLPIVLESPFAMMDECLCNRAWRLLEEINSQIVILISPHRCEVAVPRGGNRIVRRIGKHYTLHEPEIGGSSSPPAMEIRHASLPPTRNQVPKTKN